MSMIPVHQCTCPACESGADSSIAAYHHQINLLLSRLDEPRRRWYVATLFLQPDGPSERRLSEITGLDEKTIRRGLDEMRAGLSTVPQDRQRHEGGGRLSVEKKTPRSNLI